MRYPRHKKYKASGAQWLGEVPEHWGVVQLKQFVDIQNGADHKHVEQPEGYPVLGSGGIFAYASDYLYDGESVLLGRKGTIDKPLHVNGRFWTVDTMYWTKIKPGVSGRFVYYSALSIPFNYYSTNTALPSMTMGSLNSHLVCRPPLAEQIQIASFLDQEADKIDKLIAEQRRLLELLKEKRQALIFHAVTRGLNADAPTRPSDIEWLGHVPKHWEVTPLKYVVSLRSGGTPSKANPTFWDGEIPWASSKDLKSEVLTDTQDHITQTAIEDGAAELIPAGCLLIVVRGMILIHTFPVVKTLAPMAINQDLKALTPNSKLDINFLAWLLRGASLEILGRTDEAAHGTKVLRMDSFKSFPLPVPPLHEQQEIVEDLVKKLSNVDVLASEAMHAIDLLQERRSALISAATTGKIDVRASSDRQMQ